MSKGTEYNICPRCPGPMPDMIQSSKAKVVATIARVEIGNLSEKERNAMLSEALAFVEKVCGAGHPVLKHTFLLDRAQLLSLLGDHNAALTVLQKALPEAENCVKIVDLAAKCYASNLNFVEEAKKENLDPKCGAMCKPDLVAIYLRIAEMHTKLGKWADAVVLYEILNRRFSVPDEMALDQRNEMFRGEQECHYQMKHYPLCIQRGENYMAVNIFSPSAYMTTALSYKAIGNLTQARKIAAKAMLVAKAMKEKGTEYTWEFWNEINDENAISPRPFRF